MFLCLICSINTITKDNIRNIENENGSNQWRYANGDPCVFITIIYKIISRLGSYETITSQIRPNPYRELCATVHWLKSFLLYNPHIYWYSRPEAAQFNPVETGLYPSSR